MENKLTGAFILFALVISLLSGFVFVSTKILPYETVSEKAELVLLKEYKIVNGSEKTEIKGEGHGSSIIGRFYGYGSSDIKINSDDYLVFRFKNSKNELEEKKVKKDYKIVESDKKEIYYRQYEEVVHKKRCKINSKDDCKVVTTTKERDINKLFVPKDLIKEGELKLN